MTQASAVLCEMLKEPLVQSTEDDPISETSVPSFSKLPNAIVFHANPGQHNHIYTPCTLDELGVSFKPQHFAFVHLRITARNVEEVLAATLAWQEAGVPSCVSFASYKSKPVLKGSKGLDGQNYVGHMNVDSAYWFNKNEQRWEPTDEFVEMIREVCDLNTNTFVQPDSCLDDWSKARIKTVNKRISRDNGRVIRRREITDKTH